MEPSLLGSNVNAVAFTETKETEVHDWKLSPLPIVTLRGWAYHKSQHRRETSKARRPWRSVVRRGAATIRGLLATTW
jgi:hypothetical protein